MNSFERTAWRGGEATRLANDKVQLTVMNDGGHLSDFSFLETIGLPGQNVLWEAPWMDSGQPEKRIQDLSETAGFTGHALCLHRYGPPSAAERAAGIPTHGEAAARPWDINKSPEHVGALCRWTVRLPVAHLLFERSIRLGQGESVAYITESVSNQGESDRVCHWVQHATFSPPFLNSAESTLAVSGGRGMTSPSPYEGGSLLAVDREFFWPYAPRAGESGETVDLRRPFSQEGSGFLAAIQLDPFREVEYLLALNWKLRLAVGYCFRRKDFPWMALWEENRARTQAPWNGTTQARGMEFGTTPFPLGQEEMLRGGSMFGTPESCSIPAQGAKTARYLLFLTMLPEDMKSVDEVTVERNRILLHDQDGKPSASIAAHGCDEFLCDADSSESGAVSINPI